jgi:hypothetical protein
MTALVKFGTTYTHDQREYTLTQVKDPERVSWISNPVTITQSQLATIKNLPEVLAVLANSWKSPSAAASIPAGLIAVPVIHQIDAEFRAAKLDYSNRLALAERGDLINLRELEKNYKIRSFKGLKGFFFKMGKFFGGKYKSDIAAATETSVHRYAFMIEVSALESVRLKKVKDIITQSITPLLLDIEASQTEDVTLLRQLHQLTAIFNALFPNETNENIDRGLSIIASSPRDLLGIAVSA